MSCHSVLVARFDEKMVSGRRGEATFWWLALARRWFPGDVFVGAKSQGFGGSLWREGGYRESCVRVNLNEGSFSVFFSIFPKFFREKPKNSDPEK